MSARSIPESASCRRWLTLITCWRGPNRTTSTSYADATSTITVTYANQLVTTTLLDKDGRVISTTSPSQATNLSKSSIDYDGLGRMTAQPSGIRRQQQGSGVVAHRAGTGAP